MASLLHIVLIVLPAILALSYGQRPGLPAIDTAIPWGGVSRRGFRVRWNPDDRCAAYNVYILRSYTNNVISEMKEVKGREYMYDKATPLTSYGAYVRCVGASGSMGPRGIPARTLTFDDPNIATTTYVPPTASAPVNACGEGFYTCPYGECISVSSWCDGVLDCANNSLDEKDCPGHCSELIFNPEFPDSGNMTCSRFNSLDSSCFFDCKINSGWERRGPWYTVCHNGQWTRETPQCVPMVFDLISNRVSDSTATLGITVPLNFSSFRFLNLTTFSGVPIDPKTIDIKFKERDIPDNVVLLEYELSGFTTAEKIHAEIALSAGSIEGNVFHFNIKAVGEVEEYNYNDYK